MVFKYFFIILLTISTENLKQKLEEERQSPLFTNLPYAYIEIANFFLEEYVSHFSL